MDEFGCDYVCRTVGESLTKYDIPDDWCAEFVAYNDIYPIICIQVEQVRKNTAMMKLTLRLIENQDDEYAGCMIDTERKTIFFKVNYRKDLVLALEKE